jgi:hypothetical protein
MSYIGWIVGVIGLGAVGWFIWWLVRQGKLIQKGAYAKELAELLAKEKLEFDVWIKGEGALDNEATELKARHHARPDDLGNVVDVLRRAHGPGPLPPAPKSGTTK